MGGYLVDTMAQTGRLHHDVEIAQRATLTVLVGLVLHRVF